MPCLYTTPTSAQRWHGQTSTRTLLYAGAARKLRDGGALYSETKNGRFKKRSPEKAMAKKRDGGGGGAPHAAQNINNTRYNTQT